MSLVIGMIHNLYVVELVGSLQKQVSAEIAGMFGYFFVAMGTAVMLCGLLIAWAAAACVNRDRLAMKTVWAACAYLTTAILAAAACRIFNPLALVLLVGGLVSMAILWRLKRS